MATVLVNDRLTWTREFNLRHEHDVDTSDARKLSSIPDIVSSFVTTSLLSHTRDFLRVIYSSGESEDAQFVQTCKDYVNAVCTANDHKHQLCSHVLRAYSATHHAAYNLDTGELQLLLCAVAAVRCALSGNTDGLRFALRAKIQYECRFVPYQVSPTGRNTVVQLLGYLAMPHPETCAMLKVEFGCAFSFPQLCEMCVQCGGMQNEHIRRLGLQAMLAKFRKTTGLNGTSSIHEVVHPLYQALSPRTSFTDVCYTAANVSAVLTAYPNNVWHARNALIVAREAHTKALSKKGTLTLV